MTNGLSVDMGLPATEPDNKFDAKYSEMKTPACMTCKWRSKIVAGICIAFPAGIPDSILLGEDHHTQPIEGDAGLIYTPIDTPDPQA